MELEDNLEMDVQVVKMNTTGSVDPTPTIMKSILALILSELQQLRETVHLDYKKLHSDYTQLEDAITEKSIDVEMTLTSKINDNTEKIISITAENVQLKKENLELREQFSHIKTQQLRKNIVISGVAKTKWGTLQGHQDEGL